MGRSLFLSLALVVSVALTMGCGGDEESSTASFEVFGSNSATATASRMDVRSLGGTPTSMGLMLYAAYVSANDDCSEPVLLQDYGTSGQEFDVVDEPLLFSGSPADGTYECLILKMTDVMSFTADAAAVAANAGCMDTTTEYFFDTYREAAGNPNSDDGLWVDLEGNGIDATGSVSTPGSDLVYIFASTAGSAATVVADGTPIHEHQFVSLTAPMVVPGQTTFYVDASDGVDTNDGHCWIENVVMGFR